MRLVSDAALSPMAICHGVSSFNRLPQRGWSVRLLRRRRTSAPDNGQGPLKV